MISISTSIVLALCFLNLANGLTVPNDLTDLGARNGKFLKLDFTKRTMDTSADLDVTHKRSKFASADLGVYSQWYSIDLLVGSNKQNLTFSLDTGSAAVWAIQSNANCTNGCEKYGIYDESKSTTFKSLNKSTKSYYADGSGYRGTWSSDEFTIPNGPTLKDFNFALANFSSNEQGILGIGLPGHDDIHENFPSLLKKEGVISKAGYSLYLDQKNATTGSIIFGGIDTEKYEGRLTTLPLASVLSIHLNTILAFGKDIKIDALAMLDTGTTTTTLSHEIYDAFAEAFGAKYNASHGALTIPCERPDKYVSFAFDKNATIKVPYSEFTKATYVDDGICKLHLTRDSSKTQYLGDNFLRSAYIVFNLEDKNIPIAQAKFTSKSHIIPIE